MTYTTTARQVDAAWSARHPAAPTSPAELIARHTAAVEAVALYRALVGRTVAASGFNTDEHGIALHHCEAAERTLATLETARVAADQITRVAARDAALATLAQIDGDAFTQAARRQMRGRMIADAGLALARAAE